MIDLEDRAKGALLGLACGDALGAPVEFESRGAFRLVDGMRGGGTYGLAAGQWTDDTSLALCLAESLLKCGRFDAVDQLERYVRWFREGHLSSTGECFDIGNTTRSALERFERTRDPVSGPSSPRTAGNGSIMRLAPVVLFFHPRRDAVDRYAARSSETTHAAPEAVAACRILGGILDALLDGRAASDAVASVAPAEWMSPPLRAIASAQYTNKAEHQIRGSGYVVESLEAALWCFLHTSSLAEALLAAVNLGDDADTTGAVCGQLAGAYYGASSIPGEWVAQLHMADTIAAWATRLIRSAPTDGVA